MNKKIILLIGILVITIVAIRVYIINQSPISTPDIDQSPDIVIESELIDNSDSQNTKLTEFVCPTTEWVNCMPGPDVGDRPYCEEDFLDWAAQNCPDFEGAAW